MPRTSFLLLPVDERAAAGVPANGVLVNGVLAREMPEIVIDMLAQNGFDSTNHGSHIVVFDVPQGRERALRDIARMGGLTVRQNHRHRGPAMNRPGVAARR